MQLRGSDFPSPQAPGGAEGAELAPGRAAEHTIVGLSDDPLLLEALVGAEHAGVPVITCTSTDRFIDQLVATVAGIALVDASTVPAPLKGFITMVRTQFPQLLLIVAGPAHLQAQLEAQIADGTVFRYVHKPVSSQRLRLFVDAALRRQRGESPVSGSMDGGAADAAAISPTAPGTSRVSTAPARPTRSGRGALLAGLCVAAIAAGAIGWVAWREAAFHVASPGTAGAGAPAAPQGSEGSPAVPGATPGVGQSVQTTADAQAREAAAQAAAASAIEQAQRSAMGARADQLSVYLQLVRKRMASGALIEPADDSARSYLASALALAPDDPDVRAAAAALGAALIAQFHQALAAGDGAQAQRWLQACKEYRISAATLGELTAQLQTDALLRLQHDFVQRLGSGALIEPADDSALSKYRSLKAMAPESVALPGMERALRSAIASAALARLAQNDSSGATRLLAAAHDAGLDGEEIAAAARALDRTRTAGTSAAMPGSAAAQSPAPTKAAIQASAPSQSSAGTQGNAGAQAGTGTQGGAGLASGAPAPPGASAAAPADAKWVGENALTRVHFVEPSYPDEALTNGISGWVDVEFTVATSGRVESVVILDAEPKGVFEQAARTALMHSRYKPVLRDGVPVAQRCRIRVRFQQ